jgi:hydrogenase maturation protease
LGNDLRGDDGIAFLVVENTRNMLNKICLDHTLDIENSISSGINLLSYLFRYDRIIIVDSVLTHEPGQCPGFWRLSAEELQKDRNLCTRSSHGFGMKNLLNIMQALYSYRKKQIVFFLIGIKAPLDQYINYVDNRIDKSLLELVPLVSQNIINDIVKGDYHG